MSKVLKGLKQFIVAGVVGSLLWTAFLTPYVLLVQGLTLWQYELWIVMEFTLVIPVAPLVLYISNKIMKRLFK